MMIWRGASRYGGSCQPGLRSPKPCLLRLSLPVPANPGRGGSSSHLGAAPSVTGFAHAFRALAASTAAVDRSEEHTSELQSLMRISYAVFCLKKKKTYNIT